MKQGSDITNLTGFKEVLIQISVNTNQHLALLKFLYITLGEEIVCGRNSLKLILQFMTQKLTKFAKSICAIRSVLKNFWNFIFAIAILLDFYYRLTTDSFSKELIFTRKASTYFLKLSRKIFNYFSKIKFSEFRKKDILPVVVIFVLDLIKTSV